MAVTYDALRVNHDEGARHPYWKQFVCGKLLRDDAVFIREQLHRQFVSSGKSLLNFIRAGRDADDLCAGRDVFPSLAT